MKRTRFRPRYEDYSNMVHKLAWYYSNHSTVEFSELESEGFLVFHYCLEERPFDPSKSDGDFGGYFWQHLHYRFKSICFPAHKPATTLLIDNAIPTPASAEEKYGGFWDLLGSLTAEAREVIQVILQAPAEMLEFCHSPHYTRRTDKAPYKEGYTKGAALDYLRHLGWRRKNAVAAFEEIKRTLKEF